MTKSKRKRFHPCIVPAKHSKLYQNLVPSFHKNKLTTEIIIFISAILPFHMFSSFATPTYYYKGATYIEILYSFSLAK